MGFLDTSKKILLDHVTLRDKTIVPDFSRLEKTTKVILIFLEIFGLTKFLIFEK